MSTLIEEAIEALRHVPGHRQDDIARAVLHVVGSSEPLVGLYVPDPQEDADLAEAEAEAARGEFATDEEVRAIWAKHGL